MPDDNAASPAATTAPPAKVPWWKRSTPRKPAKNRRPSYVFLSLGLTGLILNCVYYGRDGLDWLFWTGCVGLATLAISNYLTWHKFTPAAKTWSSKIVTLLLVVGMSALGTSCLFIPLVWYTAVSFLAKPVTPEPPANWKLPPPSTQQRADYLEWKQRFAHRDWDSDPNLKRVKAGAWFRHDEDPADTYADPQFVSALEQADPLRRELLEFYTNHEPVPATEDLSLEIIVMDGPGDIWALGYLQITWIRYQLHLGNLEAAQEGYNQLWHVTLKVANYILTWDETYAVVNIGTGLLRLTRIYPEELLDSRESAILERLETFRAQSHPMMERAARAGTQRLVAVLNNPQLPEKFLTMSKPGEPTAGRWFERAISMRMSRYPALDVPATEALHAARSQSALRTLDLPWSEAEPLLEQRSPSNILEMYQLVLGANPTGTLINKISYYESLFLGETFRKLDSDLAAYEYGLRWRLRQVDPATAAPVDPATHAPFHWGTATVDGVEYLALAGELDRTTSGAPSTGDTREILERAGLPPDFTQVLEFKRPGN